MNNSTSSIVARLHTALTKPIYHRCLEVNKVIEEISSKELHSVLPLLLENIFGFNNQPGWGLGSIRAQYQDFRDIRFLLGPNGSLLRAIYRLDPYYRYDFPVSCLPLSTQKLLEEGGVPGFYTDKLQLNQAGRPYNMVSLNAFEYYFFHFTYFLVGPALSRTSGWSNPSESLYPVLLEDYLNFFLPLDNRSGPPAINTQSQGVKPPISHYHSPVHSHRQSPNTSGSVTPNRSSPFTGLLRLHKAVSNAAHATTSSHNHVNQDQGTEQDTWRSQVFLQIMVEFWLNHVGADSDRFCLNSQGFMHRSSPGHGSYSSMGEYGGSNMFAQYSKDPYQYIMLESYLPSTDHVRMVRMVVKHLHYFTNSSKPEYISSPYSAHTVSSWEEFKRNVLPQFVQKRLYTFFKHSFEHWPLDSSFRLILETWLSYIQPWRYTEPSKAGKYREADITEKVIEDKWKLFVVENLLFYTVLLQSFIQRCLRMDLSAPKNAYMLFRASKVFSLVNLRDMIEEAECSLCNPGYSRTLHSDMGASYLSASGHHGNVPSLLTLQFSELEGPMFQYRPLFSPPTFNMVTSLVHQILQAKESSSDQSHKTADHNGSFLSWLGFGPRADYNTSRLVSYDYEEFGGGSDIRKLSIHLEHALNNVCHIFQLEVPEQSTDKKVTWGQTRSKGNKPETLAPDCYDTEDGPVLSPLGRYQLINGLRKFDIVYEGDPELQPIRSYESPTLVRMFYALATYFNERYKQEIDEYYHHLGFKGRFARQFIQKPFPEQPETTADISHNSSAGLSPSSTALSPQALRKRQSINQPRISLRWMASYQNMGYFLALYVFVYMWLGFGPVSFLLGLVLLCCMYGCIMAVLRPEGKTKMS